MNIRATGVCRHSGSDSGFRMSAMSASEAGPERGAGALQDALAALETA